MNQDAWLQKSEEILTDIKEWRRAHPKATFVEIEDEVQKRMMRRRKVIQAEQVCAVTDGADWLQQFIDMHRSDAVRILDFPHASEHVSLVLQALEKAGVALPADLLHRCLHRLKHRGPRFILRLGNRLPSQMPILIVRYAHYVFARFARSRSHDPPSLSQECFR